MNRNDYLKFCRYYHGEKECPYKGDKALFWGYELAWIEMSLSKDDALGNMLEEYIRAGLGQFEMQDDTPATLKAVLFNRFCHWRSGSMLENAEPFKEFYISEYAK